VARNRIVVFALSATLANPDTAAAADIRVWTARAIATVLAEIGAEFERATAHRLIVTTDLPPAFLRRAEAGEPFDLVITGAAPIDEWIRDGRIVAKTRTEIARAGIGVAVKAGSPRPDISTVEAFTRALLSAKSIAYLRVGSGAYLDGLLERLGIRKAIEARVIRPDSDIVSELVARGEAELGMVVSTQILTTPGVDLVGALPSEIQAYITFAAGISSESRAPEAASELMAFLQSSRAAAVITSQGMEPARQTGLAGSRGEEIRNAAKREAEAAREARVLDPLADVDARCGIEPMTPDQQHPQPRQRLTTPAARRPGRVPAVLDLHRQPHQVVHAREHGVDIGEAAAPVPDVGLP
jgi:molybdate transport system substrate-binding protein